MFLLKDLTEEGFRQIRNDRDELVKKIEQYQIILDEFNSVLPFLESIYEPQIEISFKENIQFYVAKASVHYQGETIHFNSKLGDKEMFDGMDDPKLMDKAKLEIRKELERQFPLHFSDK